MCAGVDGARTAKMVRLDAGETPSTGYWKGPPSRYSICQKVFAIQRPSGSLPTGCPPYPFSWPLSHVLLSPLFSLYYCCIEQKPTYTRGCMCSGLW